MTHSAQTYGDVVPVKDVTRGGCHGEKTSKKQSHCAKKMQSSASSSEWMYWMHVCGSLIGLKASLDKWLEWFLKKKSYDSFNPNSNSKSCTAAPIWPSLFFSCNYTPQTQTRGSVPPGWTPLVMSLSEDYKHHKRCATSTSWVDSFESCKFQKEGQVEEQTKTERTCRQEQLELV